MEQNDSLIIEDNTVYEIDRICESQLKKNEKKLKASSNIDQDLLPLIIALMFLK